MVSRLAEDHTNAQRLAHGLAQIPGIGISPEKVQTNIVTFEVPAFFTGATFIEKMGAEGVKFLLRDGQIVRGVTHRMIETADVDEALNRIEFTLKKLS
jgi:threonine aldolase